MPPNPLGNGGGIDEHRRIEQRCGDVLGEGSCSSADARTAAACLTSSGDPIRVSVRVAAPPAESQICLQRPSKNRSFALVVAAHGDSVLINVGCGWSSEEYFVYSAGAAAATPPRPPSLLLLPSPSYGARNLKSYDTGLMCSTEDKDDLVVASLQLYTVAVSDVAAVSKAAKLYLLRHGEWSVQRPKFIDGEWENHVVVSAGNGLMCWANFNRGLIFCNVYDETPVLRYVQFPPEKLEDVDPLSCRGSHHDVCVTSDGAVKFVCVQPRCCCGSFGGIHCRHSANAYTIRIWTLKMDALVWEMDAMVDATELWALDAYQGLPRVQVAYPIFSMDEPHLLFFIVCERFYARKHGDDTEWLVLVDTKSKIIRSVYRYDKRCGYYPGRIFFPSRVSDYFNSFPCSSDGASSVSKTSRELHEPPPLVNNGHFRENNTSHSKATSSLEETILVVLQEIPGLARDDMLKVLFLLRNIMKG